MAPSTPAEALLQPPDSNSPPQPPAPRLPSAYRPLTTYALPTASRTYTQQFSDLYFSRLALLKPAVTATASAAWSTFRLGSDTASRVDRVLDVRQGELCWVAGTVFMEMPLKPNVLADVGREHWIAAPVLRGKFFDEADDAADGFGARRVMLEDESGRLRLAGAYLEQVVLVTGAIVAVLGTENADGEFEVLDLKVPDLAAQPARWAGGGGSAAAGKGKKREAGGRVALVSGLGITGADGDMLRLELLAEYLLGEAGGRAEQDAARRVSRLLVVGDSLAAGGPIAPRDDGRKAGALRKYGYDSSAYDSSPTDALDAWLAGLLPSLPVTLLPGATDPTQAALPQQAIHAALFPRSRAYMAPPPAVGEGKGKEEQVGWFHPATNPWEGDVDGWRVLATGGQPVEDLCKYVRGDVRRDAMESVLRWRVVAPTAPDTLWCYPFQDADQFVLRSCPHVFVAGNQPRFETGVIDGPDGQEVRLVAVPRFKDTGEMVLLDTETLEVEVVAFDVFGAE